MKPYINLYSNQIKENKFTTVKPQKQEGNRERYIL